MKCIKCKTNSRRPGQRWCKECHAEHMRATRPKHNQMESTAKKKANTRAYLHMYVKRGKVLKPGKCEKCGEFRAVQAHHSDYDKPLEVQWFCKDCHQALTNSERVA